MSETDLINTILPYAITYGLGHGGAVLINFIRKRLHGVRQFVDIMDDAMTNQSVTEEQAQFAWKLLKNKFSS